MKSLPLLFIFLLFRNDYLHDFLFPARSAFTNAEQTAAILMFHILHTLLETNFSASRPTSARHFSVFCVFCGLNLVFFVPFVVPN